MGRWLDFKVRDNNGNSVSLCGFSIGGGNPIAEAGKGYREFADEVLDKETVEDIISDIQEKIQNIKEMNEDDEAVFNQLKEYKNGIDEKIDKATEIRSEIRSRNKHVEELREALSWYSSIQRIIEAGTQVCWEIN